MYRIDSEIRSRYSHLEDKSENNVVYVIKKKILFFWWPIFVSNELTDCNEMMKKLQACYVQYDDDLIKSFERQLSAHEMRSGSVHQLSDENIVRLVKTISAKLIGAKKPGMESVVGAAACHALVNALHQSNSSCMQVLMTDVVVNNEQVGSYECIIKKVA